MDWLESAAFSLLVPSGCSCDPQQRLGLANFVCEMVQRGCGSRDSHQFVSDLELLGADCSASVSNAHTAFGGAMPAESLHEALAIYADVVRRPHLPADQVEDARMVCVQEIRSIEDELAQKVFQQLRMLQYGDPLGRSSPGKLDSVQAVSLDDIRQYFETTFHPGGAILGVAGRFDWPQLRDHVAELFGDWQQREVASLEESQPEERYCHFTHDSTQTHIGVGYANVPYSHPDYYQARAAVGVLSDGMSSRLFTEVRENRGLCYAVHAGCHSLRDRGSVLCYAGTTTERAQETLDVLIAELIRLSDGISDDELNRLKTKIKSALIMQQESSPARSGSVAADWYHLGRVQTLDELRGIIDGLTCDGINSYLASNRPADFRIVTLGAQELEKPGAVS